MSDACITCRFAQFQTTPTGRIKRAPGRCLYVLPPIALPLSEHRLRGDVAASPSGRIAIWPDYDEECPTHEPKDPTP